MAVFNAFEIFVEALAEKGHNCDSDTWKVYLTNNAPSASADAVAADLAEIAAGNGYVAGGQDVLNTNSRTGSVSTVACTPTLTWTASGGAIADFRYCVLHNATADKLIGWWDVGSVVSLADGEAFVLTLTGGELMDISI